MPPSTLSLLGLVRHMAEVERSWFQRVLDGKDAPFRFFTEDNQDGEFDDVDTADVAEAFAAWSGECERAREIVAAAPSLDVHRGPRGERSRCGWILVHMIEEYARHNGHADLLRERSMDPWATGAGPAGGHGPDPAPDGGGQAAARRAGAWPAEPGQPEPAVAANEGAPGRHPGRVPTGR